jgi:7,8-dihydropterin-6-yl-methyl-4-(beta-D-ribofuranosyl)aminobenzene 5'-phosphate synthase
MALKIVALIDDKAERNDLKTEHGSSFFIEYGEIRLLFDTGQSGAVVENAEKLGIDLGGVRHIVLSHGHYGHTGGLSAVMEVAKEAHIHLHPEVLDCKYRCISGRSGKYIGMPGEAVELLKNIDESRIHYNRKSVMLAEGLGLTGQIKRTAYFEDEDMNLFKDAECRLRDPVDDDQAIFFECIAGVVVVLGCAHSGVINTLKYVQKLCPRKKIFAVIGGMHLDIASEHRLSRTVISLVDSGIQIIAPSHCTGESACGMIKSTMPKQYRAMGTGSVFEFS